MDVLAGLHTRKMGMHKSKHSQFPFSVQAVHALLANTVCTYIQNAFPQHSTVFMGREWD